MARKPNNQPATAWDYRRAIELVQVLAIEAPVERWKALYALADAWGMNGYGDPAGTLHWLATHALADARADGVYQMGRGMLNPHRFQNAIPE